MLYLLSALALASITLAPAAFAATATTPSPVTLVTLDIKTVTTGGTAVYAVAAGNKTAGGWLQNPGTATTNLCINELGAATTTPSGDTSCIAPGQVYLLTPGNGAVSVNATDSAHAFSGIGAKL